MSLGKGLASSLVGYSLDIIERIQDVLLRFATLAIGLAGKKYAYEEIRRLMDNVKAIGERREISEAEAESIVWDWINTIAKLSNTGFITDQIITALTGKSSTQVSRLISNIYWGAGFGWLTWVALSPLLRNALADKLEQFYVKKYKTKRPTREDYEKALKNKVYKLIKEDGYNPQTAIDSVISEYYLYLDELGYDERYRDELEASFRYELRSVSRQALADRYRGLSEAEIKKLLKLKILTVSEVLSLLRNMGHGEETVKYEVASWLIDMRRVEEANALLGVTIQQAEEKAIPLATIKKLLVEGIIDVDKAVEELRKHQYTDEQIAYLLALWEDEYYEKQISVAYKIEYKKLTMEYREKLQALEVNYLAEQENVKAWYYEQLSVNEEAYRKGEITKEEYYTRKASITEAYQKKLAELKTSYTEAKLKILEEYNSKTLELLNKQYQEYLKP
jgi:hypothetical protein